MNSDLSIDLLDSFYSGYWESAIAFFCFPTPTEFSWLCLESVAMKYLHSFYLSHPSWWWQNFKCLCIVLHLSLLLLYGVCQYQITNTADTRIFQPHGTFGVMRSGICSLNMKLNFGSSDHTIIPQYLKASNIFGAKHQNGSWTSMSFQSSRRQDCVSFHDFFITLSSYFQYFFISYYYTV